MLDPPPEELPDPLDDPPPPELLAAELPLLISVDWLDMLSVGVPLPDSVVPLLLVKASVV